MNKTIYVDALVSGNTECNETFVDTFFYI